MSEPKTFLVYVPYATYGVFKDGRPGWRFRLSAPPRLTALSR